MASAPAAGGLVRKRHAAGGFFLFNVSSETINLHRSLDRGSAKFPCKKCRQDSQLIPASVLVRSAIISPYVLYISALAIPLLALNCPAHELLMRVFIR